MDLACGLQAALGIAAGPGQGGRSQDNIYSNTGQVPQNENELDSKGTASPRMVTGQRAEQGSETYIEVKAPSGLGSRSKTPYTNVLPRYKKAAEQAINKQQIPKSQQKRVREYFESITGGKR